MTSPDTRVDATTGRASWVPMVGLFLAQLLMSFNVAALPVSMGGMVEDFDVPSTSVSTAIVTYGLVVAALVMLGAKLGRRVGWSRIFRTVIVVFGASSAMMVAAPTVGWVIAAQGLAGASAAIIVPSLVAPSPRITRATSRPRPSGPWVPPAPSPGSRPSSSGARWAPWWGGARCSG